MDNVKTKRVYKNTLNFSESDLNPTETINYGIAIFEENLNTKYANNPVNNHLTLYIELEVVYKKRKCRSSSTTWYTSKKSHQNCYD